MVYWLSSYINFVPRKSSFVYHIVYDTYAKQIEQLILSPYPEGIGRKTDFLPPYLLLR